MPRTATVSVALILLGAINLAVFVPNYMAGRRGPDVQHLPEALVSMGCLVFSGLLYVAGLMCTAAAMKAKQDVGRAVAGLVVGSSALIWWFIAHVLKIY